LRAAKILNQKLRLIADGFLQVMWKNWTQTLVLVHVRVESAGNVPKFFRAKLLVNALLRGALGGGINRGDWQRDIVWLMWFWSWFLH
jgi:hypothetical protein